MMKQSIFILLLIFFSQFFYNCSSFQNMKNESLSNTYQLKDFHEIYAFIDDIIINYQKIDSVIYSSKYYEKEYSIIKFMHERFFTKFKELNVEGYKIDEINYFNVAQLEKFEFFDQVERYPKYESIEINKLSHILNIYVFYNNKVRTKTYGAIVFTFCLKKEGSWYIRGISFEGKQVFGEIE